MGTPRQNQRRGSLEVGNVLLMHQEMYGQPHPTRHAPKARKKSRDEKAVIWAAKQERKAARKARRAERKRLGIIIPQPQPRPRKKNKKKQRQAMPDIRVVGLPYRTPPQQPPKWGALPVSARKLAAEKLAKQLQANPPKTEKAMLETFKEKASRDQTFRFFRNRTLGPFIPDFYFPAAKMIVECDGPHHPKPEQQEHDSHRDLYFEQRGVLTMRFDNFELAANKPAILKRIYRMIESRNNQAKLSEQDGVPKVSKSPVREDATPQGRALEVTSTYEKSGDSASA